MILVIYSKKVAENSNHKKKHHKKKSHKKSKNIAASGVKKYYGKIKLSSSTAKHSSEPLSVQDVFGTSSAAGNSNEALPPSQEIIFPQTNEQLISAATSKNQFSSDKKQGKYNLKNILSFKNPIPKAFASNAGNDYGAKNYYQKEEKQKTNYPLASSIVITSMILWRKILMKLLKKTKVLIFG